MGKSGGSRDKGEEREKGEGFGLISNWKWAINVIELRKGLMITDY